MAALIALRLEDRPAEDTITAVAEIWCRAVMRNREFDRDRDSPRFAEAFGRLAETCRRWPAPVDLIAALPRIDPPRGLTHDRNTTENRQRAMAALGDVMAKLGIPAAKVDP